MLLDHGADVEEPNDEGYTPLMEASREGHKTVVELLLNRGANVNAKIDDGLETPLTLAASGGFRYKIFIFRRDNTVNKLGMLLNFLLLEEEI